MKTLDYAIWFKQFNWICNRAKEIANILCPGSQWTVLSVEENVIELESLSEGTMRLPIQDVLRRDALGHAREKVNETSRL